MKYLVYIVTLFFTLNAGNSAIFSQTSQTVTLNVQFHEGNIKEVVKQSWNNSVKPQLVSWLRSELNKAFINSSVDINIPEPVLTITSNQIQLKVTDFFFDGTYSVPYWPNPDINVHFDLTITGNFGVNSNKELVLTSVTYSVSNVDLDIDGALSNAIISLIDWIVDGPKIKTKIESMLTTASQIPGLSGIVLSKSIMASLYPGTSAGITLSLGQLTYTAPYLNFPVNITFMVGAPGGGQQIPKLAGMELIPETFVLDQNYPNPFNPSTSIRFGLPEAGQVSLIVYNLMGQEVATIINNEHRTAGFHSIAWDAKDNTGKQVSSGVYIYRVISGNHVISKKMSFIK